jgi:hypothetical protein
MGMIFDHETHKTHPKSVQTKLSTDPKMVFIGRMNSLVEEEEEQLSCFLLWCILYFWSTHILLIFHFGPFALKKNYKI